MANRKNIQSALDRTLKNGDRRSFDMEKDSLIIFSDHHRGREDGADDFFNNKDNYLSALKYYLEKDHHLLLLGDIEEFWENPLSMVMRHYSDVLQLEKSFHKQKRLTKIWGNHDDAWQFQSTVRKHLNTLLGPIVCPEAVVLEIESKGKKMGQLLLVHGHQGNAASDRFAGISKFFVRYVWRNIQRWFKIPLSTPRKDKGLKSEHDFAFYSWASVQEKTAVICGHTHQPVFTSKTHIDALKEKLVNTQSELDRKKIESEINTLTKEGTSLKDKIEDLKPCYFNTGCCSFADGDITGIEISNGQIALVKWNDNGRKIIENQPLRTVFETDVA